MGSPTRGRPVWAGGRRGGEGLSIPLHLESLGALMIPDQYFVSLDVTNPTPSTPMGRSRESFERNLGCYALVCFKCTSQLFSFDPSWVRRCGKSCAREARVGRRAARVGGSLYTPAPGTSGRSDDPRTVLCPTRCDKPYTLLDQMWGVPREGGRCGRVVGEGGGRRRMRRGWMR